MNEIPERDEFDRDDELRAQLRGIDPAASLSPADPTGVARLLEEAMSHDVQPRTDETRTDGLQPARSRSRNPLTWLVAAAAVVLVAGVGITGLVQRDSGSDVTATDGGTSTSTGPDSTGATGSTGTVAGVTRLTAAPAGVSGRCIAPTPEVVAAQGVAFEGTVTSIVDGVVTLSPTSVYTGKVAATVEVSAPAESLQALIGAVKFEEGNTYLVSATNGQVTVCGFSGPATDDLQKLYDQAFPGR